MPPANNIGFSASSMVTSTIGVQTSCPNSPTYTYLYSGQEDDDYEDDICPRHFTDIHKCKLEDTFSRRQKPDDIQLQIIAMECNLLYKDVRDWFRKRRIRWMDDLVRNESSTSSTTSTNNTQKSNIISSSDSSSSSENCNDSNNNNTLQKKPSNLLKHNNNTNNNTEHKNNKKALANSSTRSHQEVITT